MKFLFDNNLSFRLPQALAILDVGASVTSLREHYPEIEQGVSVTDIQWLSELGKDEQLAVITIDRRILTRTAERRAFKASRLRLMIVPSSFSCWGHWKQAAWFVKLWPSITAHACSMPVSTAVLIRENGGKFDRLL